MIKQTNNLPEEEFKALAVIKKKKTELRQIIEVHHEHFKKEIENIKKTLLEINESIAEIIKKKKNTHTRGNELQIK